MAADAAAAYLDNPGKYASMSDTGRQHNVDEANLSQVSREAKKVKKLRAAVAAEAGAAVEAHTVREWHRGGGYGPRRRPRGRAAGG